MRKPESLKNYRHIIVTTKEEAWAKVNELFPSGIKLDERATEWDGCPHYTVDGDDSTIAETDDTIRIAFEDKNYAEYFWIGIAGSKEKKAARLRYEIKNLKRREAELQTKIAELEAELSH